MSNDIAALGSTPRSFDHFSRTAIVGAVVVGLVAVGAWRFAPPARSKVPVEKLSATQCRPMFDAVVSDSIPNVEYDERDACSEHFASWVRSVPDTPYRVDGGALEVRGGRFSLSGAKVWSTAYAVGNEQLPAVLVVMDTTAATLHFQSSDAANRSLTSIVAGGAARQ